MEDRKAQPIVEPKLVWLDLETTGLDPYAGSILEVGIIITDLELNEKARKSWILQYERDDILPSMDDYVLNMHLQNGLLKEVWGEKKLDEDMHEMRVRLREERDRIWNAIMLWIIAKTERTLPKNCYLAGSSVHFDRAWLDADSAGEGVNKVLEWVSHRMVDVSLFKAAFPDLLTQPDKRPAHRVLDDLDYSISQLYQMRQKLDLPSSLKLVGKEIGRLTANTPKGMV